MASFPHPQDDSTAPQHQDATDAMTSTSFAASLLQAGKLAPTDHETLVALIKHDLSTAAHRDGLALAVNDNISISLSISHRQVEAVAAVFNTAELLEAIFFHLPATNLALDVPLVCKGFREAVQSSQKLQRRMYRPLKSSSFETPDFFGAPVAGFQTYAGQFAIALDITSKKMKPLPSYDGVRSRQLSCPGIKSAALDTVDEEAGTGGKWIGPDWVYDLLVQSGEGITFGDILDIVEQDRRRRSGYDFTLKLELLDDGCSSDGWRRLMDGGELKVG